MRTVTRWSPAEPLGPTIAQVPGYMVSDAIAEGTLVELLRELRSPTVPIHAVIPANGMVPARARAPRARRGQRAAPRRK